MSTIKSPRISAWQPETDQFRLAVLGKLGEEAGELATRACRCIIQGIDEADPDTRRLNREELAREIADVEACIEIVREVLGIVPSEARRSTKANGFRLWHALLGRRNHHAEQ